MPLADAVRNPFATQRYFVYVDGTDVSAFGMRLTEPPSTTEAMGKFSATCELKFNFIAEQVNIGARLQLVESLDGYLTSIFTGKIMRPAGTSWPPRNTIWCSDALWQATLPAPVDTDQQWENTDDATVIEEALGLVGITEHNIQSSNWTLGTLYPVLLPRRSAPSALIQRIDAIAGYYTLASGSGLVYRIPLPLYPGAPATRAFAYVKGTPGANEYKVYDATLDSDGIEDIRNQIEVTGARLTLDYESPVIDEITDTDYGNPQSLSQLPSSPPLTVSSEFLGGVTFVEDTDYIVNYSGVGTPLVGTITIIDRGGADGVRPYHLPLTVEYNYIQEEAGGQITASAGTDNAYLEPGVRLTLPVPDDLIQDFGQAQTIAENKLAENNRLGKRLTLVMPSNPALRIGQTITYRDDRPTIRLYEDTPFLVTSISRKGKRMTASLLGGDGGPGGYLDPRPPIADFDYVAVGVGSYVYLWLNGERSWDPDGDIASYAWSDNRTPSNTASGVRAGFVYDLAEGTTVTVSLIVTDSTGLPSQTLGRTVNLNGSQADINSGRYQYVRAIWYDSSREYATGPNGTHSMLYSPALSNPLSRYYGPQWRIMDRRGRVAPAYLQDGSATNETYLVGSTQARAYTSWLDSRGALVYQDGDDIILKILDVSGHLIPTFLGQEVLAGYELPPVVGINGLDWVWYQPSEPTTMRVVTLTHILESQRGEPWREVLASAGYGGNWRGMAASAFDAAYALDIESTTPLVMSDGEQPEFPEPVEVFDLGAWYTSSTFIVNCRWLVKKVDGEWVVSGPIEYDGYIEPQLGFPYSPLTVEGRVNSDVDAGGTWRAIPYPAVDELFFIGGGSGNDEAGDPRAYGTYLYALSSDGSPAQQVAFFKDDLNTWPASLPSVAGPSIAPIDAVTVISDDTMLVLVSDTEPVGYSDVDYDDSNWDAAVELGD
jgi:hypothetical protein